MLIKIREDLMKSRLIFLFLSVLIILLLCSIPAFAINGIPHIIYGKVFNADGTTPEKNFLETYAYKLNHPDEILNKTSAGCGYELDSFLDGWLWFEAGNYITPWAVYENLRIIAVDINSQETGVADIVLDDSGGQHTPDLHLAYGDHVGPIASNTMADGQNPVSIPEGTINVTLTADLNDTICGNSNIQKAEYFIDTDPGLGAGNLMDPNDGIFDNPLENVISSIKTFLWTKGSIRKVYVRGQDSVNNWGTADEVDIVVTDPTVLCDPSIINSNFNGTAISTGNFIWFNSIFKVKDMDETGGSIRFVNSVIQFTANGINYNLIVPDAMITFSPTATVATTAFNTLINAWETIIPSSYSGNVFLSGLAYQLMENLPGGINPVTWSGYFMTDTPGITAQWKWAAAVYTNFSAHYNSLGVKPIDGDQINPYHNSDHAGTPEYFKPYVIGGARGGGASNYTGGYSGTESVLPCAP